MSGRIPPDAFQYYAALGPGRSYRAVADHYGVSKRAVTRRATKENWSGRLEEIERRARERADDKLVEHLEEMQERHLKTARFIQARGLAALKELSLKGGMEAVKATETGIRLERLITGDPSNKSGSDITQKMRDEMERWMVAAEEDVGDEEEETAQA